MLKRIAAVAGSVALGTLATLALATPAHASASWVKICNYSGSVGPIAGYNNSVGYWGLIYPGNCINLSDSGGNARVDVDPEFGPDVRKYRRSKDGGSWGSWNCNERSDSDPYSDYTGVMTKYHTSTAYC